MSEGLKCDELTSLQDEGLGRLEACAREGMTIRAYAKREGLSEQQLYQMAKVLRAKGVLVPSSRSRKAKPPGAHTERRSRFVEIATHAASGWRDSTPPLWRARLANGGVLEGSTDLGDVLEALSKL